MYSEIFITGCDHHTEWQLPWFVENFRKHNETELFLADFGISKDMQKWVEKNQIVSYEVKSQAKGWFKKPRAMLDATVLSHKVCWVDTDCEILGNIEEIFNTTVPHKIGMCEDRPWTRRRPEYGKWYNSGVVCFEGKPNILRAWADECIRNPFEGDQEVLYGMMRGDEILKLSVIEELPRKYNTLRLDYIDSSNVKNPLIVHHTGRKGKYDIAEKMGIEINLDES